MFIDSSLLISAFVALSSVIAYQQRQINFLRKDLDTFKAETYFVVSKCPSCLSALLSGQTE